MQPQVAVIMPVYNGEKYLSEAIESILSQTYTDFEFIIIDDGSCDNSLSIARDYASSDKRILLIMNQQNLGISVSLNKGIRIARGEYIARMDADDISDLRRLEYQVDFMDANPEIGICGTWVKYIDDLTESIKLPADHDAIHARLLFENALAHPSVMMRAVQIREQALNYDEEVRYAQDYELWSRAVTKVKLANVEKCLLLHRVHSQGIGTKYRREQLEVHSLIYRRMLEVFGLHVADEDIRLHQQISTHRYGDKLDFLRRAQHWLNLISNSNKTSQIIQQQIIDGELREAWGRVCQQSPIHPLKILVFLITNPTRFSRSEDIRKVLMRIWTRFSQ